MSSENFLNIIKYITSSPLLCIVFLVLILFIIFGVINVIGKISCFLKNHPARIEIGKNGIAIDDRKLSNSPPSTPVAVKQEPAIINITNTNTNTNTNASPQNEQEKNITIEYNDFINIVKNCTKKAFSSAVERLEIKEKIKESQVKQTKDLVRSVINELETQYRFALTEKNQKLDPNYQISRDHNIFVLRHTLDQDFDIVVMGKMKDVFSQNHLAYKNESEIEHKIDDLSKSICTTLERNFVDYGVDDIELLSDVFENLKSDLYEAIASSIKRAKDVSIKGVEEIDKEKKDHEKDISETISRWAPNETNLTEEEDK